jgi:hypothetical protein
VSTTADSHFLSVALSLTGFRSVLSTGWSLWVGVPELQGPAPGVAGLLIRGLSGGGRVQACGAVIASKDALIAGLKAVLKDKDEEYVRALKRAAADIEALLAACHRSFQQLQAAYHDDLAALERSFLADRTRLLARSAAPPRPPLQLAAIIGPFPGCMWLNTQPPYLCYS